MATNSAVRLIEPKSQYGTPERLSGDSGLSLGEKKALLEQWKYDLIEELRASEENMRREGAPASREEAVPGDPAPTGESADFLRRVNNALQALVGEK